MKSNFMIKIANKPLLNVIGNKIISRKIYVKHHQKREKVPETSAVPQTINKISSSTRFIPHTFHEWENTEI